MRKGVLFLVPLAFAAALHMACSDDTRPPNVFNTDVPDTGAPESEGGMKPFEPIDATTDAKGCSETTTEILRNPVVIEFAVDESGSMDGSGVNDKWGSARDALLAAFEDMHNEGDPSVFVGALRWSTSVGNKEAPGPIADTTHYDSLVTLMDTPSAGGGGTNMATALPAAYAAVESFVPPPGFLVDDIRRAVVLVSDGVPVDADKPICKNLAEKKLNEPPPKGPILTFAVGIGPFPSDSIYTYDPEFMSWIAVKGGTAPADCSPTSLNPAGLCHFQITPAGADNTAATQALIDAIKKIRVLSASCEFKFTTTAQTDLAKVTVEITDKDGNKITIQKDEENGWSFDDPENPTKILLHGEACSASNGTISGKVEVILGCKDET